MTTTGQVLLNSSLQMKANQSPAPADELHPSSDPGTDWWVHLFPPMFPYAIDLSKEDARERLGFAPPDVSLDALRRQNALHESLRTSEQLHQAFEKYHPITALLPEARQVVPSKSLHLQSRQAPSPAASAAAALTDASLPATAEPSADLPEPKSEAEGPVVMLHPRHSIFERVWTEMRAKELHIPFGLPEAASASGPAANAGAAAGAVVGDASAEQQEAEQMPAWTRAELHVLRQNSNALKVICSQLVNTARLERRKARELQEKLTSTETRLAKNEEALSEALKANKRLSIYSEGVRKQTADLEQRCALLEKDVAALLDERRAHQQRARALAADLRDSESARRREQLSNEDALEELKRSHADAMARATDQWSVERDRLREELRKASSERDRTREQLAVSRLSLQRLTQHFVRVPSTSTASPSSRSGRRDEEAPPEELMEPESELDARQLPVPVTAAAPSPRADARAFEVLEMNTIEAPRAGKQQTQRAPPSKAELAALVKALKSH